MAETPCVTPSVSELAAGLLQEQEPLMQDADDFAELPLGHEQSETLHDLGLIKSLSRKRTRYEMFKALRCFARGLRSDLGWRFLRWSR